MARRAFPYPSELQPGIDDVHTTAGHGIWEEGESLSREPLVEKLDPARLGACGLRVNDLDNGFGADRLEESLQDREVEAFPPERELGGSPLRDHVSRISVQEAAAKFPVDDGLRSGFSAAMYSYVTLENLPPEEQPDGFRRITLDVLASPDPRLSSSAIRDVALSGGAAFFTSEDLLILEPLLENSNPSVGVRVALLAELERGGLVEGPPRWVELLRETSGQDRFAVVRAVSAHPSPAVTQELIGLLADDDPLLVSTAAVSLGTRETTRP